jgi:hypothetical protein
MDRESPWFVGRRAERITAASVGVRAISNEEGNRLLRIVRRGAARGDEAGWV